LTLRLRRLLGGGKIKRGTYKPEKTSPRLIREAMDKIAPDMALTAQLQQEQNYTISFDITKHNLLFENQLRTLRKKGVDFDYYTGTNQFDGTEEVAVAYNRPKYQERLFIEFKPRDNLEWSWIRGMFGLPSEVTTEVSEEETIETVSDR
jgi:hypothetical protein